MFVGKKHTIDKYHINFITVHVTTNPRTIFEDQLF